MAAITQDRSRVVAFGRELTGAVGLAAGLDRDGSRVRELAAWGFAFAEVGTVTPLPVSGHNPGAAAVASMLAQARAGELRAGTAPLVGVNLGVQPGVAPAGAWHDYVHAMQTLWPVADFLVLNFSSDAAQALREPRHAHSLRRLLVEVHDARLRLAAESARSVPVLVKWPVGADWSAAAQLAQHAGALGCDGMVAAWDIDAPGAAPWETWVPDACAALARSMPSRMTLIAVGGIDRVERARAVQTAGARLVEVYRGFCTQGPGLVRAIDRALRGAPGGGPCVPAV
jgi:dihydroorotate dehydrogenase